MGYMSGTFDAVNDGKTVVQPVHPFRRSKLFNGRPEAHHASQIVEENFRMYLASNHLRAPDAVAIFNALHEDGDGRELPKETCAEEPKPLSPAKAHKTFKALKAIGWVPPNW